jgi:hypothetical protein
MRWKYVEPATRIELLQSIMSQIKINKKRNRINGISFMFRNKKTEHI